MRSYTRNENGNNHDDAAGDAINDPGVWVISCVFCPFVTAVNNKQPQ